MNDKKERITIEISAELKKKVVAYCAEYNMPGKDFITAIIEDWFRNK